MRPFVFQTFIVRARPLAIWLVAGLLAFLRLTCVCAFPLSSLGRALSSQGQALRGRLKSTIYFVAITQTSLQRTSSTPPFGLSLNASYLALFKRPLSILRPKVLKVEPLSFILLSFFCLFLNSSSLNASPSKDSLVVGSKFFTESYILGEMVAILLEEKFHQPVQMKLGLGGTQVAFKALKDGEIHVYPEYTGTGYAAILKEEGERHPDKIHQIVNRLFRANWGIEWSQPLGFNNTYAIAVRRDDDRFKGILSLSQLSKRGVGGYKYAAPYEFMERKDGQVEFAKRYNLKFEDKQVLSMEAGLMYSAIRDKKVDIIVSYSTDGRIRSYNLRLLEDDRLFFPPYHVSLISKSETLEKYPSLRRVFEKMKNLITEDEMIYMNDQVDRLKREPKDVAQSFLEEKGLIEKQLSEKGDLCCLL